MEALFGLGGLIGSLISIIIIIVKAKTKQPKRSAIISLFICILLFIGALNYRNNKESIAPTPAPTKEQESTPIPSAEQTTALTPTVESSPTPAPTEEPLVFILLDEVGEYGEKVVLNPNTDFEEEEIEYHVPVGKYLVTNLNDKSSIQLTVYCGGPEYDGEWQYFVSDDNCSDPVVLMPTETKELIIKEGQFIVLSDGEKNAVQFIMTDEQ